MVHGVNCHSAEVELLCKCSMSGSSPIPEMVGEFEGMDQQAKYRTIGLASEFLADLGWAGKAATINMLVLLLPSFNVSV